MEDFILVENFIFGDIIGPRISSIQWYNCGSSIYKNKWIMTRNTQSGKTYLISEILVKLEVFWMKSNHLHILQSFLSNEESSDGGNILVCRSILNHYCVEMWNLMKMWLFYIVIDYSWNHFQSPMVLHWLNFKFHNADTCKAWKYDRNCMFHPIPL